MDLIVSDTWARTSPSAYASALLRRYDDAAWIVAYFSERVSETAQQTRFCRDVLRELNRPELISGDATPDSVSDTILNSVENPIDTLFSLLSQMQSSDRKAPKDLIFASIRMAKSEIIEGQT